MTESKLRQLFTLANELYQESQNKSATTTPIPYCWIRNNETGQLLIFSEFSVPSNKLLEHIQKMPSDCDCPSCIVRVPKNKGC